MLGNNIMPMAYDNVPANIAANIPANIQASESAKAAEAADIYKISCEGFDACKLQYYNPQPIVGARLAHAYVPFQCLCCLYPPLLGLKQGTIFPELDRPYGADPAYSFDG